MTDCGEILFFVVALSAAELQVMDVQISHCSVYLASPVVAV